MARIGVTYGEVAEAAAQLIGQGRNPTVEQIRFILGTGSSTTIANHLRQWKANQESTTLISAKENLPPEFVSMMKGLWERVINHSQEQVSSIEVGYQQTIAELDQEVEKYKTNNQRWQKMYDQWIVEKNQFAAEQLTLEQALEFAHKENASLHAKQDSLLQQLQDRDVRIDELHRLHRQGQENLEHYRESAREQRLLDQQQFEQQKQQLQFEIKNLNEHAIIKSDRISELQQENQSLAQSYSSLENDHAQTLSLLDHTKIKLQEVEKVASEQSSANLHWQNRFNELQNKFDLNAGHVIDVQTENKILMQQKIDISQSLKESQDRNQLLSHEKLELTQEKAHLEGRLRQMQEMIVT